MCWYSNGIGTFHAPVRMLDATILAFHMQWHGHLMPRYLKMRNTGTHPRSCATRSSCALAHPIYLKLTCSHAPLHLMLLQLCYGATVFEVICGGKLDTMVCEAHVLPCLQVRRHHANVKIAVSKLTVCYGNHYSD